MRIKLYSQFLFSIWFLLIAASSNSASEEVDKDQFRSAYASYLEYFNNAEYSKSLPYAETTLKLGESLYGQSSKNYASLHYNYGINLLRAGESNKAFDSFRNTLSLYIEQYGNDGVELIGLYMDLATARKSVDYLSKWTDYQKDAVRLARKAYGKNSSEYGILMIDAGHIAFTNGQISLGENQIRNGYKIIVNNFPSHPRLGYAHFVMGKVEMAHSRYKRAIEYLTLSLDELDVESETIDHQMLMSA